MRCALWLFFHCVFVVSEPVAVVGPVHDAVVEDGDFGDDEVLYFTVEVCEGDVVAGVETLFVVFFHNSLRWRCTAHYWVIVFFL